MDIHRTADNIYQTPKILTDLAWSLLEVQWKIARFVMMYKPTISSAAVTIPPYIRPKTRSTRQFRPKKFIELVTNTKA